MLFKIKFFIKYDSKKLNGFGDFQWTVHNVNGGWSESGVLDLLTITKCSLPGLSIIPHVEHNNLIFNRSLF